MEKLIIPEELKAGFNKRSDTYSGLLAYIIYKDSKTGWRQERSWNTWKEDDVEPIEFKNEPYDGFVLNKKAGDYGSGWNHRISKCRVFDSRYNFEFEITIENLLFILENVNSIKGKALDGEFVYAWDNKNIVLLPVNAPDYKEIKERSDIINNGSFLKTKDFIIGNEYMTKKGEKLCYLGKHKTYNWRYTYSHEEPYELEFKNKFWFACNNEYKSLEQYTSVLNKFVCDLGKSDIYEEVFEKMERSAYYSPIDDSADEYIEYTKEELLYINESIENERKIRSWAYYPEFYIDKDEVRVRYRNGVYTDEEFYELEYKEKYHKVVKKRKDYYGRECEDINDELICKKYNTFEELINDNKLCYLNRYLENGKLYSGGKYEE